MTQIEPIFSNVLDRVLWNHVFAHIFFLSFLDFLVGCTKTCIQSSSLKCHFQNCSVFTPASKCIPSFRWNCFFFAFGHKKFLAILGPDNAGHDRYLFWAIVWNRQIYKYFLSETNLSCGCYQLCCSWHFQRGIVLLAPAMPGVPGFSSQHCQRFLFSILAVPNAKHIQSCLLWSWLQRFALVNADGRDRLDGLTLECCYEFWLCLVQVVASRLSVKFSKFPNLLCYFGGTQPPKARNHDGVLLKLLEKRGRIALQTKPIKLWPVFLWARWYNPERSAAVLTYTRYYSKSPKPLKGSGIKRARIDCERSVKVVGGCRTKVGPTPKRLKINRRLLMSRRLQHLGFQALNKFSLWHLLAAFWCFPPPNIRFLRLNQPYFT